MVRIVPQIRRFELSQIDIQIDFQIISEKLIYDCTICMNKLNNFRVNRQIIFFSDQGNDLTLDIQGTNSQPKQEILCLRYKIALTFTINIFGR